MPGQRVEQLGVGRRVGLTHVVLGLDQSAVEEMFPITIGKGFREITVVLRGHPIDERQARIVVDAERRGRNPQAGGFHGLLGFLVGRLGDAALVKDNFLADLRAGLAPDAAEERAEAVVILLAPFLVRMMMALGALKALAEEKLGGV